MTQELKRHKIDEKIQKGERCEGCLKLFKHPRRSLIFFMGRHVCRPCSKRKNMPLVGYTDKIKWKESKKIEYNDRKVPYLTWDESKIIWKECMSHGLSEYQAKAKIRAIKLAIRKNHWAYNKNELNKPKKILPL